MNVVKIIGFILLAIYLILTGLITISAISLTSPAKLVVDLIAIAAGILLLISIGRFLPKERG